MIFEFVASSYRLRACLLAALLSALVGGPGAALERVEFGSSPASCAKVAYGNANRGAGTKPGTPPNPDGVTIVGVGIFVTQLRALDPVGGSYDFRGNLRSTWCDPRLAFAPDAAGPNPGAYFKRQ